MAIPQSPHPASRGFSLASPVLQTSLDVDSFPWGYVLAGTTDSPFPLQGIHLFRPECHLSGPWGIENLPLRFFIKLYFPDIPLLNLLIKLEIKFNSLSLSEKIHILSRTYERSFLGSIRTEGFPCNHRKENTQRKVGGYSLRISPCPVRKDARPEAKSIFFLNLQFPFWTLPETLTSRGTGKSGTSVEVERGEGSMWSPVRMVNL